MSQETLKETTCQIQIYDILEWKPNYSPNNRKLFMLIRSNYLN